jgi:hypothetical protein
MLSFTDRTSQMIDSNECRVPTIPSSFHTRGITACCRPVQRRRFIGSYIEPPHRSSSLVTFFSPTATCMPYAIFHVPLVTSILRFSCRGRSIHISLSTAFIEIAQFSLSLSLSPDGTKQRRRRRRRIRDKSREGERERNISIRNHTLS